MPLTRIKTKGLGTSVTFENITDTGTEGTKVATGTTAQRGSTEGELRFNTTTGKFEGRNAVGNFVTIEATPTVIDGMQLMINQTTAPWNVCFATGLGSLTPTRASNSANWKYGASQHWAGLSLASGASA